MADAFIGEIKIFAGFYAPVGWALCDGSLLPISRFSALFDLIGTSFGGDGQTQFALPDLRGRMPVHIGHGSGLSNRKLGDSGGAEEVTLSVAQLPKHKHTPNAYFGNGDWNSCARNYWSKSVSTTQFAAPTENTVAMNSRALATVGENKPHENMPPFLAFNFIIALG